MEVKKKAYKPRIRKEPVAGLAWQDFWFCDGYWGRTPQKAFDVWFSRVGRYS